MDKISITICGDGGCGKSSITMRLVRSQWVHERLYAYNADNCPR
ncbi:unnamed protein product [Penicillium nalgiovense]|nr:unnamed protein product [Penicillium nalgiovense]